MSYNSILWNLAAGLMPDEANLTLCNRCFFFVSLVLGAWTHPYYYHTRLARYLRVPLSIVSAIWWVYYPFAFIEEPRSTNVATNIGHCLVLVHMLSKCLDWGLFSGPQSRRKYITSSDRPSGEWVPTEKDSKSQPSYGALVGHVFSQFTSVRGSQYPWGQFSQINHNTWQQDLFRLVTCQIYSVAVVTGLLYIKIQELPSIPITQYYGWHESMPSPTVGCLVRFLATTLVMTCVCVIFETVNLSLTMLAHLTHPIVCQLGLPEVLCEFTNPIYYPPLFNNLSSFSSLSEFWGKSWHQIFRRFFLVVGVFPLTGAARGLGVSPTSQKIIGLMAAFLASGSMHAFQFYLMADSTTSTGTTRFWDSFAITICFLLQGLGVLIEPIVIPLVPKRLGGGKLWTICFLLLTIPLYSNRVTQPYKLLSVFKPLDEWNIINLLTPLFFAPIFDL